MRTLRPEGLSSLRWDDDGLIPAVVQDADTRRVLMLGYVNQEALGLTFASGQVHFWSRSRGELWRKGATSGNTLEVVEVGVDCDADALLILARPTGSTCHLGSATCWDDDGLGEGFARLEALWSVISSRAANRPEGSYTVRLLEGGPDLPARKLVEEATEVLLAVKDHAAGNADDRRLAEELADVLYHLLVVVADRGLSPRRVFEVLGERSG